MADEIDPIERFYARYQADRELERHANGRHWQPIDWDTAWNSDYELEWLVDGLWPVGKHLHIFAAAKSGKSILMLWIAANIAIGRDPFTGATSVPHTVAYVDREMSERDVLERVQDMGFESADLKRLEYFLFPTLAPLDTNEGGKQLLDLVQEAHADTVVFDTLSRVVQGDENSNDTYRNFHLYTGTRLKAAGISMARLDHEGKITGSSRGASAKVDDVDLIYQLVVVEKGVVLKKFASRVSFTQDSIALLKTDDPLSFRSSGAPTWPTGTMERVRIMDELNMPIDISQRQAKALFKQHDVPAGKTAMLQAAINYRKARLEWP